MPARALPPVVNSNENRKQNQRALSDALKLPSTPRIPWNFRATSKRGGILLEWAVVDDVDGYEIVRSDSGDFSENAVITVPLRDPAQNNYFDSLGGAATAKYYRLRATSGTLSNPHAVHGLFSGTVKHTSIDASDVVTASTTVYDTVTNDAKQRTAGSWQFGTNSPFERKG